MAAGNHAADELQGDRAIKAEQRNQSSPSTVPKVESQIPQELDMAKVDIDCSPQSPGILGHVVAEDDTAHGALAGARLAH